MKEHFSYGSISSSAGSQSYPDYKLALNESLRAIASSDVAQPNSDFKLALDESLGFFQDVTSRNWEIMRSVTLRRVNIVHKAFRNAQRFYQNNWDPDFSCQHDTKVGWSGEGAKWVCDPLRIADQAKRRVEKSNGAFGGKNDTVGCLVYSIGSNGNFQFENGLSDIVGPSVCEIHTFDFGDYSGRVPPGRGIHYHSWGLKPSYETDFSVWRNPRNLYKKNKNMDKFLTLQEMMERLGHVGRPIDIFKIDCGGCEWITYKDWIKADIRQILVEVHHVPQNGNEFFSDLQKEGFVTFHKQPNLQCDSGRCVEYAMIKLNKTYVENRIQKQAKEG